MLEIAGGVILGLIGFILLIALLPYILAGAAAVVGVLVLLVVAGVAILLIVEMSEDPAAPVVAGCIAVIYALYKWGDAVDRYGGTFRSSIRYLSRWLRPARTPEAQAAKEADLAAIRGQG